MTRTTWATTTYARDEDGMLVETHVPELDGVPAYAVEVSDDHGRHWATNGLRWTTEDGAKLWATGLAMRWFGCTDIRVTRCDPDGTPGEEVYRTL